MYHKLNMYYSILDVLCKQNILTLEGQVSVGVEEVKEGGGTISGIESSYTVNTIKRIKACEHDRLFLTL